MHASEQLRVERTECRDSVRVEREVVAVHDTIMEVTTIFVRENEQGDTLRLEKVTERDRYRDRAQVKNTDVEVRLVRDTIYVEKRDSTRVSSSTFQGESIQAKGKPAWVQGLKWIFWIIVALGGLIVLIKVLKVFSLFHF